MDVIGKISGITELTRKVVSLRPVSAVERAAAEQREPDPRQTPEALAAKTSAQEQDPFQRASEALGALFADRLSSSKLRIDLDRDAGRFVYQAVDIDSGEIVMQFPAEEMLRILSFYRNEAGLVVDDNA